MRLEISRKLFLEKLEMVAPVIPARSNFPVLQNVLFGVSRDKICLSATDLDISINCELPFPEPQDLPEESFVIRGKELLEILRAVSEPVIGFEFETEENRLKLEAGKGVYIFSLLEREEFPELPQLPKEVEFEFSSKLLHELFSTTSFAISRETGRPTLSGVLWEVREKEVRMVATDGHRLALIRKEGDFVQRKFQAIIPPKAFEILPHSDENDEKIKVGGDSALIGFVGRDYRIISRLIEGPYPDYEKVLPAKYPFSLTGAKGEFVASLERALVFVPATKLVIFNLQKKKSYLEASSEIGIAKEEIKGEYKGETLRVALNGSSLSEILRHIDSEDVELSFASETQAIVIKPVAEAERKEKTFLLMPMRME